MGAFKSAFICCMLVAMIIVWVQIVIVTGTMTYVYWPGSDAGFANIETDVGLSIARNWDAGHFEEIIVHTVIDEPAQEILGVKKPAVKVKVCPPTHPEEVFYDIWNGLHYMCDCLHREGNDQFALNRRCYKGDNPAENDCFDYSGRPGMIQPFMDGKQKVCGKRSKTRFHEAQRVLPIPEEDLETDPKTQEKIPEDPDKGRQGLECEEGYTPCQPNGIPNAVFCYKDDKKECPIQSLSFTKEKGKLKVSAAKTGKNMPMVETKLSQGGPCKNPLAKPSGQPNTYYAAEVQRELTMCSPGLVQETGPGYKKISGLSISQYDLEASSGVLDYLEQYPSYTHSVFPGSSSKKSVTLDAYGRSYIPWSIACDADGRNRTAAYDTFSQGLKSNPPGAADFNFTLLAFIIALLAPLMGGGTAAGALKTAAIGWIVASALLIIPNVNQYKYMAELSQDLLLMQSEAYGWISECAGDDFRLDTTTVNAQLTANLTTASIIAGNITLFIVIIWGTILFFLSVVMAATCGCEKCKENCKGCPGEVLGIGKAFLTYN